MRFCASGGYRPIPAKVTTVGAYVGWLADKGTCQPQTISTYLAPIRKRHLAAGRASPTEHHSVREALAGARNEWLDAAGTAKPKRCALPSRVAWRLSSRAHGSANHKTFLKLTAVTTQFLWGRRAKDILSLRLGDVQASPDGAIHFQIRRSKMDSKKAGGERLAHVYPPSPFAAPDFPLLNLRRLLRWHRRNNSPPHTLLFSPIPKAKPGGVLTGWLREGLADLGIKPPLGQVYASHSARAGFITAGRAIGLSVDALCQFAGLSRDVLEAHYLDSLAQETSEAHLFFSRLVPAAVPLPTPACVLPS